MVMESKENPNCKNQTQGLGSVRQVNEEVLYKGGEECSNKNEQEEPWAVCESLIHMPFNQS